jgi:hypothetical protein
MNILANQNVQDTWIAASRMASTTIVSVSQRSPTFWSA